MLDSRNANPEGYPFSERTLAMYRALWLNLFKIEEHSQYLKLRGGNHSARGGEDLMSTLCSGGELYLD